MENKDNLILERLNAGKSYTDIMAELSVSPSRISVVKKRNLNAMSSRSTTNDALLGNISKKSPAQKQIIKAIVPDVISQPDPPPIVEKVAEPGTGSLPDSPPLNPEKVKAVTEQNHLMEVKLSEIKSVKGKRPFSLKGNGSNTTIPEARIIKRYLSLDKKHLYLREFIAFLDDLQALINTKKITKSSEYAPEIMHIQNELVKHIRKNQHVKGSILFTLDSRDKFISSANDEIKTTED